MSQPIYQYDRSFHVVRKRRYRRRSLLTGIVIAFLLAAAAYVAYDLYKLRHQPIKKSVGASYQQTVAGDQVMKSSYFQFSDSMKWSYAANDSTATKLTYLLYIGGLPAHSLTVYVNQQPTQDELATTRVLPVQIRNGNALSLQGDISDPCGKLYQSTDLKKIKLVNLSGTSMLCVPDSPQYYVQVGQVGKDYNLSLKRASGEIANYIIVYRNLTISPDAAPFIRAMKTFQAL